MRPVTLSFLASLAGAVLSTQASPAEAQVFNEYSCSDGQCTTTATHVTNTPWSSTHTVELGWYDLGSNVRRLGFCVNGVRTFAETAAGFVTVGSTGSLSSDVSFCGGSGVEKFHTFHGPNEQTTEYLQCGGGSSTAYRLRPISLTHDIVVSTRNGTSSNISLWFIGPVGSDGQVTICGGNGNDTFQTNADNWMDSFGGNDELESYASSTWMFGGSGNDTIVAPDDAVSVFAICGGGSGSGDYCYFCDNPNNECEHNFP